MSLDLLLMLAHCFGLFVHYHFVVAVVEILPVSLMIGKTGGFGGKFFL